MTSPMKVKCHVFQVADPYKPTDEAMEDMNRAKITLSALTYDRTKRTRVLHSAASITIVIDPNFNNDQITLPVNEYLFNVEWAMIGGELYLNNAASESVYTEWRSTIENRMDERYDLVCEIIGEILRSHLNIVTNLQTDIRDEKTGIFEAWAYCRTIASLAYINNLNLLIERIKKAEHLDKNREKDWFKSTCDADIRRIVADISKSRNL